MKKLLLLCVCLLLSASAVAHADDRRDLDDCMLGDYQTSVQACTRLLDKGGGGTNLASLYVLRGYANTLLAKNTEALADFGKAIGLAPKADDAYNFRSLIYHAQGRDDLASADLEKSRQFMKEPSRDAIQDYCVGMYLLQLDQSLMATLTFEKALQTDPKLAAAYVMRGQAQGMNGEPDKAVAGAEKAIQLDPQYSAAFLLRGQARLHQKQFDMALADFNQAIALNPKYNAAFYSRGVTYVQKGDKERAVADFRQALAINPGDQASKDGLKRLGVSQ